MDNWADRIDKVVWDFPAEDEVEAQTPTQFAAGKTDVFQALLPYLERVQKRLRDILSFSGPLEPILTYLMSTTGKLLRPMLVISSAWVFAPVDEVGWATNQPFHPLGCRPELKSGQKPDQEFMISMIIDIAAACEMVHIASLVHDDIIDGSSERRGLPVIHDIWGIHSAILTGDYLLSRANNTALMYPGIGVAGLLNDAVELMCRGEIAQDSRLYDSTVTACDYFYQAGRKTAALMAAACKAGAMAAGGAPDAQEHLWQFGIRLGTAFQIADDILDLTSDEKTLGKPVFNDLKLGTLTLPLIYAMETTMREDIVNCFGNKALNPGRIPELRKKLISSGCIRKAARVANSILESSRKNLLALPPSYGRDYLLQISMQLGEKVMSAGAFSSETLEALGRP